MDWQQPTSLAVVAVAGFLMVRREIRARRRARSRACGADCSCGAQQSDILPTARKEKERAGDLESPR